MKKKKQNKQDKTPENTNWKHLLFLQHIHNQIRASRTEKFKQIMKGQIHPGAKTTKTILKTNINVKTTIIKNAKKTNFRKNN